jgi:hypothetical protein
MAERDINEIMEMIHHIAPEKFETMRLENWLCHSPFSIPALKRGSLLQFPASRKVSSRRGRPQEAALEAWLCACEPGRKSPCVLPPVLGHF